MQSLELFVGIGHDSIPLIFGNVVPGSEVKIVVFEKGFGLQDAMADGFAHKVPIDNRRLLWRVNLGAQDAIFFSGGEVAINRAPLKIALSPALGYDRGGKPARG